MKQKLFFSVKKPTNEEKDKLIQMILNDEFDKVSGYIIRNRDAIAIGELAEDEQFLFYINKFKYYQPTEDSISIFLNKEDRIIVDNLGNKVSVDEFWDIIIANQDKLNTEQKLKNASEEEKALFDIDEMDYYRGKDVLKYHPLYGEFYNDNLRFSAIV